MGDSTVVWLRMPVELHAKLKAAAKAQRRPLAEQMRIALEEAIARQEAGNAGNDDRSNL
jgi:predicted transcriptional regulator